MSFDGGDGQVSITLNRRFILILAIGLLAVIVLVVFLYFWVRRPEKVDALPTDWTEYSQVCSDHGAAFVNAPKYEGAGPHGIVAFAQEPGLSAPRAELFQSSSTSLPWARGDERAPQLIVCANRVATEKSSIISCSYSDRRYVVGPQDPGRPVSLYKASYEVTVYEARTHDKVVEGLKLSGDNTSCPYSVDARASDVFSWPSDAQWEKAIGRYVDGGA
jgi:hypothetical protein